MSRVISKIYQSFCCSGNYAKYTSPSTKRESPSKPDSVLRIPDLSPEVRGRVRAQHPDWSGSAESHSTVHPGGKVLGQVIPAGKSTAGSPANKVMPQARQSILILSKTYPSSGIYLAT